MINIPKEIEELLQQSSITKNLRISFPYDELEDICNDRIVSESMQFTESFCSQEKLKFGLCEASAFKVDCFDVPNIKGKTIDVSLDIECADSTETIEPVNNTISVNVDGNKENDILVSFVSGRRISWDCQRITPDGKIITSFETLSPLYEALQEIKIPYIDKRGNKLVTQQITMGGVTHTATVVYVISGSRVENDLSKKYKATLEETCIINSKARDIGLTTYRIVDKKIRLYFSRLPEIPFYMDVLVNYKVDATNIYTKTFPYQYLDNKSPNYIDIELDSLPTYNSYENQISIGFKANVEDYPTINVIMEYTSCEQTQYYTISLGQFTVDKSKKDSSNMNKRKIEAYSKVATEDWIINNPVTVKKQQMYTSSNENFVQNLECIVASELDGFIRDYEKIDNTIQYTNYDNTSQFPTPVIEFEGNSVRFFYNRDYSIVDIDKNTSDLIMSVENVDWFDIDAFIDKYWEVILTMRDEGTVKFLKDDATVKHSFYYQIKTLIIKPIQLSLFNRISKDTVDIKEDFTFYPYLSNTKDSLNKIQMFITIINSMALGYTDTKGERHDCLTFTMPSYFKNLKLRSCHSQTQLNLSVKRIKTIYKGTSVYLPENLPFDNVQEPLESVCEVLGGFGKFDRNGLFLVDYLSNFDHLRPHTGLQPRHGLHPHKAIVDMRVRQNLYSTCWYDDDYTKPYSKVTATYKNSSNEEEIAEYIMVDTTETDDDGNLIYNSVDYQIYDVSDNFFIKNNTFTEETIMPILTQIGEKIKDIKYMPFDVEMIGMPHIEAGDSVIVKTNEGSFDSYILRRTLRGIQSLKDSITSD